MASMTAGKLCALLPLKPLHCSAGPGRSLVARSLHALKGWRLHVWEDRETQLACAGHMPCCHKSSLASGLCSLIRERIDKSFLIYKVDSEHAQACCQTHLVVFE